MSGSEERLGTDDATNPTLDGEGAIADETITVRLDSIIEHAPDSIIVADANSGRIVAANETAADLLDVDKQDLIGRHQRELHPAGDRDRYAAAFARSARDDLGPISTFDNGDQLYVQRSGGECVPVEINSSTIELRGRRLVQGYFRDISDRLRRRRQLRVFREAVEHAGHSVFITDTKGQIEYANPAFEAISGYSREEVLGKRPSILKSGVHDDTVYNELWSTILSGEVWEGELINEDADGNRYVINQTIAPITDDSGTIERFVAINHDITALREREQQLERERERLEEFAGTVAHDLRTPLSIASGDVDLAANGHPAADLERARDALERMDRLIDEILQLSKQGKTVDDCEHVRLHAAVEQAWQHLEAPDGTLSNVVDPSYSVVADRSRLVQLLENVLENAVDHGGPGVDIVVEELTDGDGFAVADDGPGVDPGERKRVFDAGVTMGDGTGYGLSIVQQIAKAHGWSVDVETAKAGGARFVFRIPPATTE